MLFKLFVSVILCAGRLTPMAYCSALLVYQVKRGKVNSVEKFNIPQYTLYFCAENNEKLKGSLQALLNDKGFRVSSASTKNVLETAQLLVSWCSAPEHLLKMTHFTSEVFQILENCLPSYNGKIQAAVVWFFAGEH